MADVKPTPNQPTNQPTTDIEPEKPVEINRRDVRPDDGGRIQYEDEVRHTETQSSPGRKNPSDVLPPDE